METLDLTQPSQIRLLYYISPARFYVYLQEKSESHLTVNDRVNCDDLIVEFCFLD